MDRYDDMKQTERLLPGDKCEFRFPARREWHEGTVVDNGGGGYWQVRMDVAVEGHEVGDVLKSLYIEHVRAPGTDPWFV